MGEGGAHGAIIKEIDTHSLSFNKLSFIFEDRATNFDAHHLAKFSCSLPKGRHMCFTEPHDPLVSL